MSDANSDDYVRDGLPGLDFATGLEQGVKQGIPTSQTIGRQLGRIMAHGLHPGEQPYLVTIGVAITFQDWMYATSAEDAARQAADPDYLRDVADGEMTEAVPRLLRVEEITEAELDGLLPELPGRVCQAPLPPIEEARRCVE